MAYIEIPDGVLTSEETKELERAIKRAAEEKRTTGRMTLDRFIQIIKNVCSWIWNKIKTFVEDLWTTLGDIFS